MCLTKIIKTLLVASVFTFSLGCKSVATELATSTTPPDFRLSYIDHPSTKELLDVFVKIYSDLGFNVILETPPIGRGLGLIQQGLVDADIARFKTRAAQYNNILILEPKLFDTSLSLLCDRKVLCSKSALNNSETGVVINLATASLLADTLTIKSQLYYKNDLANALAMLRYGRVDYLIYPQTPHSHLQLDNEFNSTSILELDVHHVMHKRHNGLAEKVTNMLMDYLNNK